MTFTFWSWLTKTTLQKEVSQLTKELDLYLIRFTVIKNIIDMLEILKTDHKNLGKLSKIALGKNKMPESIKEGLQLLKMKI